MTTPARKQRDKGPARALIVGLVLIGLMLVLAAAWHWTPLREYAEPSSIIRWVRDAARSPWTPVLVAAVFVGGSLVLFPNTVLSLGVILALGPLKGTAYAFGGTLVAAFVGYAMGRWGGRRIEKLRVPAVDRISAQLRDGGFVQVLALRLLPVAPFSATNVVAGAAHVRVVPFAAATAVGVAPYILAFGMFGRQAQRLMSNPSMANAGLVLAILAVAALVMWQTLSRWKQA